MSRNQSPRRSLRATAPQFLQSLSVKDEGNTRILECRVDGYPKPDIQWEKFGRPVGKSRRIHMTRTGDRCLLQIKMPQTEDNGLYSCVATNIIGVASTQAKVSTPYLISRRIRGISPRLNSNQTKDFNVQIIEQSTIDQPVTEYWAKSEQAMFRKRSQSGGSKSRQHNLSLPTKKREPTFTSHIWQNSDDRLSNRAYKDSDAENITSEKKRLCKSMEDCRKTKKNIFKRVKIPDIFNGSQNVENKTSSLRSGILQPSQKVNGVINRNNSVPSPQTTKRNQQTSKFPELSSKDCVETPVPLTTKERIAAYLKRFETSNSSKVREPLSDKTLKKQNNARSKECHTKSAKSPESAESDKNFFSFSKFKRRKNSSSSNQDQNLNHTHFESSFIDGNDTSRLESTPPKSNELEKSQNSSHRLNDIVLIEQKNDANGFKNENGELGNGEELSESNNNAFSSAFNKDSSEIDLNALTFDHIDVSILEELDSFQNISNRCIDQKTSLESKKEELKLEISLGNEKTCDKRDIEIPTIHVQLSADDNEGNNKDWKGIEEIIKHDEKLTSCCYEKSLEDIESPNISQDILRSTDFPIKKECESIPSNGETQTTEILESEYQKILLPEESPARIVKGPQSVTILRGESVTLAISFTGFPSPQVIWMKGGRVLKSNGRLSILDGSEMSVVTVNEVTADDSGKYVVSVENDGGSDSCFASVAVVGFPEPPGGEPTANEVTDHSLVLSWYGSMYDGGSVVTGYQVEMCTIPCKTWHKVTSSVNTSCTVQGLSKGQRYLFRVRAENRYGLSHPSKESRIIRLDDFLVDISSDEETGGEEKVTAVTVDNGTEFSDRFDLKEEVGKGRFGTVYRCVEKSSGRPRAAKIIRCLKIKDKEKVKQEIEIMSRLHHPKLMQVLAAFESGRNMIMVMEFISGGELFERVIADDFVLTEQDCVLFMRQICDGVAYMHKNDILHLDLKPENILCKTRTSHKIKIIDFGLARYFKEEESLRILFGTPEFVAPEVINYEPVCPASDMWSVGVICYVLISGLSPFMGDSDTETFANITRGEMDFDDEAFDDISEEAKDFISKLLVKKLKARMSAEECLRHSWLATATSVQKRPLSTEKLKRFIIRRKWQKSGTAIRALGRMVTLSRSSMGSSCDSSMESPRSSRSGSSLLSRSETAESGESDVFQDLSR